MSAPYDDFDLSGFWEESEYATREYVGDKATREMIEDTESELGYKLPESYLTLMKNQNGGIPNNSNYPMKDEKSGVEYHIAIAGIFGLGSEKTCSLLGELGGEFMKTGWGYPDIGVYICDCPSAGHDMIALDYRDCGKSGEPKVVHVDQASNFKITFVADSFEAFIRGLVHDSECD